MSEESRQTSAVEVSLESVQGGEVNLKDQANVSESAKRPFERSMKGWKKITCVAANFACLCNEVPCCLAQHGAEKRQRANSSSKPQRRR